MSDFDSVLKSHGLTRSDVIAGQSELWGKYARVIDGRMKGLSYKELERRTYRHDGGAIGVERAALHRLKNIRFYGPVVAIPEPVKNVIRETRRRESIYGSAWRGALYGYQEVTS